MGMGVAAAERNYTGRNYGHTGKQDPAAEKVQSRGAQEETKTQRTATASVRKEWLSASPRSGFPVHLGKKRLAGALATNAASVREQA